MAVDDSDHTKDIVTMACYVVFKKLVIAVIPIVEIVDTVKDSDVAFGEWLNEKKHPAVEWSTWDA